jgi:hypothetical protein
MYIGMNTQLVVGQHVVLESSQGRIQRVVVEDMGEIVLVTREEEYRTAKMAGNQPVSIGFRRADIIDTE